MTTDRPVRQESNAPSPAPREDLYRLAAEATGDCLYDWDPIEDVCACSEAYVRKFGQPGPSAMAWLIDRIHPDDLPQAKERFDRAIEDGLELLQSEYRLRALDGSYCHVEDRAKILRDEQGVVTRVVGSVRDVTARTEALQRLEEIRHRYELATTAAKVGVWDWNIQTGEFYLDPVVKGLLGYCDDELPNDLYLWSGLVHPDDQEAVMRAAWDHIDGRTAEYVYEHRMMHKDGTIRWILVRGRVVRDADGTAVRMTGTDTDITARKKVELELASLNEQLEQRVQERTRALREEIGRREIAQQRLAESERLYRLLTENATDILILAGRGGRFEYVSPACRRILGYDPEEVILQTGFGQVHPDDRQMVIDAARACDADGGPVTICYRRRHRDGHYVWLEARAQVAQRDADGTPSQIACVLRDVTDRRVAEEALRRSQRRFQDALDNSRHFMYRFDFVADRYEYISPCLEELTGWSMDEFLKKGMADVLEEIHPDDVGKVEQNVQRACAEAKGDRVSLTLEYRRRLKDGRYIWISDWVTLLLDENKQPILSIGSAYDITERVNAEIKLRQARDEQEKKVRERTAALAASEEKWRSLVAAAPDHIVVLSADEVVEFINRDLPAEAAGDLVGRSVYELMLPEYWEMVRLAIRDVLETGQMRKLELLSRAPSGRCRWYSARLGPYRMQGRIVGVIAIATDITDRKETQDLLAIRTRQLEALADNAPDPIFRATPELTFAFVNRRIADMLDTSPEQLVGKSCEQAGMPESVCWTWKTAVSRVFESARPEVVEVVIPGPQGDRQFQSHLVPEMSADGRRVETVLGISRDITDLKNAQKKLLDYQQQLRSLASQLAVAEERQRREIASGLHDRIGQSLAALKLDVGLLDRALDPSLRPRAKEIMSILNQIMADTRTLTFELCPPMLYEVGLEAAVEWLAEYIGASHRLEVAVIDDGSDKPLSEDVRGLAFQAVRELLVNVTKHAQAERVRVSMRRENGCVCVSVADDGVGFDVRQALAIRSQADRPGGFGLFNIRERISHFGGRMEVESDPETGSCLRVILPIEEEGSRDHD